MTIEVPKTNGASTPPMAPAGPVEKLWEHPNPESTEMYRFKAHVSRKHNVELNDYHGLWQWSVDNIPEFWGEVWDYTGVRASKPYTTVRCSPATSISPGSAQCSR